MNTVQRESTFLPLSSNPSRALVLPVFHVEQFQPDLSFSGKISSSVEVKE
jgi:hypothetical protein